MTFLAPWAAWFLAGIPVIILLYLLKVKRRHASVSTLLFWQRALQENRQRALFHRLRNLLSLLLQLLIFLLLVGALAKPAWDAFLATGSDTVLILDTRARMQTIENDGVSRFEKARQLAIPYLRQAGNRSQVALVLAGASATVAVPFSGEVKPLEERLASLKASDAGGTLDAALDLADALLSSRQGRHRIVVFTDTARSRLKERSEKAGRATLSYLFTGTVHDNVAITRFSTRPLPNSPQTSEVLLEIRNFGGAPAIGNVDLMLDGRSIESRPFEIEPGGRKIDFFPIVRPAIRTMRGWLSARIDTPDPLPLDNTAYALLPTGQPARVLLVTRENWFLEKLLAADHQIRFELLTPDAFALSMAEKFDAILFDNFLPPDFRLGQTPGNYLFFKKNPFTVTAPELAQPLITETDAQHPILRLVNLQNLTIVRASPMQVPAADPALGWTFETPLRAFDQPILITATRRFAAPANEQRIAALSFDVAESDLPLRIAFPLLVNNAIQWLTRENSAPPLSLVAGETVALDPQQGLWPEPQTDVEAPAKPEPWQLARTFFQPLHAGYYLLTPPAPGGSNWLAVNPFSETESDLRGIAPAANGDGVYPVADLPTPRFLRHPLWHYLAMGALILSTMEWFLFHRRRTE